MKEKPSPQVFLIIGLILISALLFILYFTFPQSVTEQSTIGGPYRLTTHTGKQITDQEYIDQYKLIYFGFTFCPDICPTELGKISAVMDQLGEHGTNLQPIFITVDPARDTAEALAGYVPHFHEKMIGLTGTSQQIKQVADAYKVYYARPSTETDDENYLMNHSSYIFFMGPKDQFIQVFSSGDTAQKIATSILPYLKSQ